MAATQLAAVGGALDTLFAAALAAQNPPVPVYRGGEWLLTSAADTAFVLVGSDGALDQFAPAGTEEQEPAEHGDRDRTARGSLTCAVVSQTGDQVDSDGCRARAEILLGLLDAPLRADATLGGLVQFSWVEAVTAIESQNANGYVVRYVFQLHYEVWV